MEKMVFDYLWRSSVPSKVIMFSWTLLLNKIPMRANIAIRNVLPPNGSTSCAWCERGVESSNHLFLHCDVAGVVWRRIEEWVELNFITPIDVFIHLECRGEGARSNKLKPGFLLIWHAIIWTICRERNGRIFNERGRDIDVVMEEVRPFGFGR